MAAPTATGVSWSALARKGGTAHSACLGGVVLTLFTFSEFNFVHSFLFLSLHTTLSHFAVPLWLLCQSGGPSEGVRPVALMMTTTTTMMM